MNSAIVNRVDRAMASNPVRVALERVNGDLLRVLAYHGVDDPVTFTRHMEYVRGHFNPISVADLIAARRGIEQLPNRALLVTFDDGERSVLHEGVPILERFSVPAAVFVIAGALEGDAKPFWWQEVTVLMAAGASSARLVGADAASVVRHLKLVDDTERLRTLEELRHSASVDHPSSTHVSVAELKELSGRGIDIGNHSLTHPCLVRCATDKIVYEVRRAHEIIATHLKAPPVSFAYPNGDCDGRVRAAVESCGYELAFLFDHGLTAPLTAPALALSRLRVNSTTPLDRFKAILSGAHPALHRLRGRR